MTSPTSNYKIVQVVEVNEELLQACQRLVPQLTSNNPPPNLEDLISLLADGASTLIIARDQTIDAGEIVGLASLVLYRVPTGMRAYIEDVVVVIKPGGEESEKPLCEPAWNGRNKLVAHR